MTVGLRVTAPVNHRGEWKGRSPWCWGRMEAHKARSVAATSPKKPSLPSFPCPYSPGRAKHPGSRLPKCHRHPSVNPAHRAWGSCLSHSGRRGSLSCLCPNALDVRLVTETGCKSPGKEAPCGPEPCEPTARPLCLAKPEGHHLL